MFTATPVRYSKGLKFTYPVERELFQQTDLSCYVGLATLSFRRMERDRKSELQFTFGISDRMPAIRVLLRQKESPKELGEIRIGTLSAQNAGFEPITFGTGKELSDSSRYYLRLLADREEKATRLLKKGLYEMLSTMVDSLQTGEGDILLNVRGLKIVKDLIIIYEASKTRNCTIKTEEAQMVTGPLG